MRLSSFALAFALLQVAPAAAQSGVAEPLKVEIGETGEAYLDTIRWRRLQSDVTYFDPAGAAPELNVSARMPRGEREVGDGSGPDWPTVLIVAAILLAVAALFAKFGTLSVIGFRGEPADRTNGGHERSPDGPRDEVIEALDAIRAIGDRGEALNRLLAAALALAARAAGMRLDPSWTVRDVLRRIPEAWPFRIAVTQLARDAELAHFGGRPVSEDQLEHHLKAMVPVFRGEAGT